MNTTAKPQYDDGVVKYLLIGAVIFLVLGTFVGTFAAAQLAWPVLNFDIPYITFGRLRVIHTNIVIFAFGGMTLMATAYYTVQRTNGRRLWSNGLAWVTTILYTIALLLVVLAIGLGITTGKEYHEQEWPLAIVISIVWVMYTINFMMTIASRNREKYPFVYVSNFFFMGMMIAVTYLYVVNGLAIPVSWFQSYPIFGGVQGAMIQWWWGHNAVGFFLTAGFLAIMYYFVPKQAQRPIYSYRLSVIHFWALMFGYVWLGAHHLQYTALPDWTGSLGAAISLAMIIPSWGGALNGILTLSGAWDRLRTDYILRFLILSLAFYAMATFEGPVMSTKTVNALSHYTDWTIGHVHAGALGWVAMVSIGAIYHMVMKLWSTEMYSMKLINTHFWLATIGTAFYIVAMWISGIMQGLMWRAYNDYGTLAYTFVESSIAMHPYYVMRTVGGFLFFAGTVLMLYNITVTLVRVRSRNKQQAKELAAQMA